MLRSAERCFGSGQGMRNAVPGFPAGYGDGLTRGAPCLGAIAPACRGEHSGDPQTQGVDIVCCQCIDRGDACLLETMNDDPADAFAA